MNCTAFLAVVALAARGCASGYDGPFEGDAGCVKGTPLFPNDPPYGCAELLDGGADAGEDGGA
jgi:hypothetical protein